MIIITEVPAPLLIGAVCFVLYMGAVHLYNTFKK